MDVTNDNGNTALHMAARNGQVECVRLLCDAGASLDLRNDAGQLAREEASTRVAREFRYHGTSHAGVLEVIDASLEQRHARALLTALQRLALAALATGGADVRGGRLGSATPLARARVPRRAEDGSWELLDMVVARLGGGSLAAERASGVVARQRVGGSHDGACSPCGVAGGALIARSIAQEWAWRAHQRTWLRRRGGGRTNAGLDPARTPPPECHVS